MSAPAPSALSVAVVTRDRREMLLGTLAAVVDQLEPGDELIVVDNGSGDGSAVAARALLATRFVHGQVLREVEGLGISTGRNRALAVATRAVVCFLDDDEVPAPGWLAALRSAWAQAGPRVGVIGGPMRPRWCAPRPRWLTDDLLYVVSALDLGARRLRLDQRSGLGFVWGGNMSVRRDAAREVGGFDPLRGVRPEAPWDRGEEEDLQRRLAAVGWETWYEPDAAIEHAIPAARLTRAYFRRAFRNQGRAALARGRRRRDALLPLARAVARWSALAALASPEAPAGAFPAARCWAQLTTPRRALARP